MVKSAKNSEKASNQFSIQADLVMVSDVHLRGPSDPRCLLLCDVIDRAAKGSVTTFLLLGDIFDICIGGPKYYESKYSVLISKLEALAKSGTRVVFLEGNHEFSMARMGWESVEIVDDEAMILDIPGVPSKIAIRHGDLLNAPASYKVFRTALKSRLILGIAGAVPPTWLESYGLVHAKASRSRDPYRKLDHHRLMAAAERWLTEQQAEYGIFGHFHVPYAEPRKENAGLILSVNSWDEPNYLFLSEGKFFRGLYNPSTKLWDIGSTKPFLSDLKN